MTTPPPSLRRKRVARLAAVVAGLAAALVTAEIVARVLVWATEGNRRLEWEAVTEVPEPAPGTDALLAHLLRPCANPRRIYELIPGMDVQFTGQRIRTNAHGFRGPAIEPEAEPGARPIRIVGIGDSIQFGWGVPETSCYLRRLERALRSAHPARRWDVINTGVPGYNTAMEVETLRDRGLAFDPELVVVGICGNDLDLPNFLLHSPDYWALSTSFLAEWVVSTLRGWDTQAMRPLVGAPRAGHGSPAGEDDLDQVPAHLRDLVGLPAFEHALDELAALATEHEFDVVVSTLYRVNEPLRSRITARGFAIVEGESIVRERMADGTMTDADRPRLQLHEWDPHPSELGHEIEAEALYRHLSESGWIAEQLLRPR